MRNIFPHITGITAAVEGNSSVRVFVWTVAAESERDDLAVALTDSGTGIGQVLAMLYVVVTSDFPRVIIIDEPQSFLHPGAVRKLFEVFSAYPQHQYIVTTHSPVSATTVSVANMLMIRRDEQAEQNLVERLDPAKADDLRLFLSEVGARLGDVYGADAILWVEGKTEEVCFPQLVRELANVPLDGVQILGVVSTDELTAKHAGRIFDIYRRISGGNTLLPPALAFLLDSEERSEAQRVDVERKANGLVRWLPRRMYENYLLDAEAICEVLAEEDPSCKSLGVGDYMKWLSARAQDAKFWPKGISSPPAYPSQQWFDGVHGAELLRELFGSFTEQRVEYDKVRHGLKLTRVLIKNKSPALCSLAQFVASLLTTDRAG